MVIRVVIWGCFCCWEEGEGKGFHWALVYLGLLGFTGSNCCCCCCGSKFAVIVGI